MSKSHQLGRLHRTITAPSSATAISFSTGCEYQTQRSHRRPLVAQCENPIHFPQPSPTEHQDGETMASLERQGYGYRSKKGLARVQALNSAWLSPALQPGETRRDWPHGALHRFLLGATRSRGDSGGQPKSREVFAESSLVSFVHSMPTMEVSRGSGLELRQVESCPPLPGGRERRRMKIDWSKDGHGSRCTAEIHLHCALFGPTTRLVLGKIQRGTKPGKSPGLERPLLNRAYGRPTHPKWAKNPAGRVPRPLSRDGEQGIREALKILLMRFDESEPYGGPRRGAHNKHHRCPTRRHVVVFELIIRHRATLVRSPRHQAPKYPLEPALLGSHWGV
ncbi:hypothetical protein QBC34DRAFT_196112 [Podospora aff. communis PSN243]|uniref:Uncharacterized protein n=1 Tax=Podospora aff. communis PSN243 TaxID=3040156 RepID=A0AAV9G7V6_9PEZI|nr:hypothetical protein QBC34DRAFT_196112 [Podospora aff. communis PSN243]